MRAQTLYALPAGEEVVSGDANFDRSQENTLNVNATNNTIIQWNGGFNVGANETVNFTLPTNDSFLLNRIMDGQTSVILGMVTANGNIVLINGNGFYFGPNANVNVGGLIASTHDITNANFQAGNYIFNGLGNSVQESQTSILNEGHIQASQGGMAVLIADAIDNQGVIEAPIGTVGLAAGDVVAIVIAPNGLSIAVDAETAHTIKDKDGNPITEQIKNSGTLNAGSGKVVLNAQAADQIFEKAINLEGEVRADEFVIGEDGSIEITGSGPVSVDAEVSASGVVNIESEKALAVEGGSYSGESVTFTAGTELAVNASTVTQGDTTFQAKENIAVNADVTTTSGDLVFKADSDFDGSGAFLQAAGTLIKTVTSGSIKIYSSGQSTLANITSAGDLYLEQAGAAVEYVQHQASEIITAGTLRIGSGVTLTAANTVYQVAGDWVNGGNFIAKLSFVKLIGDRTAQVLGNNTFNNFEISDPGKIVKFEAEKQQDIIGVLTLHGAHGNLLVLTSTVAGVPWKINATGTTDLSYIDLMDSTNVNIHGPPLTASYSKNSLNNLNWDFSQTGPVFTNSNSSSTWSDPLNWDGGFVPGIGDIVRFSPLYNYDSTVDTGFSGTVGGLIFESGYTGTMTLSRDLHVSNDVVLNSGFLNLLVGAGLVPARTLTAGGDITLGANATLFATGSVTIHATDTLLIYGTVDGSNLTPGGVGASIKLLGNQVGIMEGALIDVNGDAGGGTVLIGGDYLGSGDTPRAEATVVQSGALVRANALNSGNGGRVIVWSDEFTNFGGMIEAKAMGATGNGGFVETSSKEVLQATGSVDVSSAHGTGGSWLLDPHDITISAAANSNITGSSPFQAIAGGSASVLNVTTLTNALISGNVIVTTAAGSGGNGDITVSAAVVWNSAFSLTLNADRDIVINAAITNNGSGAFTATAVRNINVNAPVTTTGGNITLNSNATGGGTSGWVSVSGPVISNGGNILIGGDINASGYAYGNSDLDYGVRINNAPVSSGAGSITIRGHGDNTGTINLGVFIRDASGVVQSTTGDITIIGVGGAGTNDNYGVYLFSGGGYITTVSGAITITGSSEGTGTTNAGVVINSSNGYISSTGNSGTPGTVTITGTGGNGTSGNYGVQIFDTGYISVTNANLIINGTGGNGSSNANDGVDVGGGTASTGFRSLGSGTITVNAQTQSTGDGISSSGSWTIGGASATGNITINVNVAVWGSLAVVTDGTITFAPYTASTTVGVAGGSGTLDISSTLLGNTSDRSGIIIGRTDGTGDMAVSNYSWPVGVTFRTSTGNITITNNAGSNNFTNSLTITTTTGTVTLTASASNILTSGSITTQNGAVVIRADNDANTDGFNSIAASITTNGGNITIGGGNGAISAGSGYATGNATTVYGVYINNVAIAAGGGNIIINGRGRNVATNSNHGVYITGASGSVSTTGSGTIDINGLGGGATTNSASNYGVLIEAGATVSTVTGALNVTGTGGGAGTGTNNYGVYILNGSGITSTGASTITVTGIRGSGDTSTNFGFATLTGTNTVGGASATGDITIITDTISLAASTNIQTSGNITVRPYTASTTIGVGAGAGTLSLTDTFLSYFTWGTVAASKSLTIGGTAAGNITINSASTIFNKNVNFLTGGNITLQTTTLTHTGATASTLTMKAYGNITISSAISANTSALTILLQSDFNGNSDGFVLVSAAITSNGGNITMCGGSGTCSAGSGYAYGNATQVQGVFINNVSVAAGGGNIIINGRGYNTTTDGNYGFQIEAGTLSTTGSGTIDINGIGGGASGNSGSNFGVLINGGAIVTTVSGAINVTGTGGGAGLGTANYGVYLLNPGSITSTGSANITVTGIRGGGDTSDNYGFVISGGLPTLGGASATGDILIITDTIFLDTNTTIQTSGNITVRPYTASTTIGVGAGAGTLSLTDTFLSYFTWGTVAAGKSLTIGSTSAGNITINSASTIFNKDVNFLTGGNITLETTTLTHTGATASTLTMKAYGDITISSAISANTSALTILIQSNFDGGTDGYINVGAAITSNGGNITLCGGSGTCTAGSLNADGTVNAAATGFAYGNGGQATGVYINNVTVAAGGGNIIVNGRAASTLGLGVQITGATGALTTTGTGTISVSGTAGGSGISSNNYGVEVDTGGTISTVNGNLTVIGIGGGSGTDASNYGVYITGSNSTIKTTGSGSVFVNGTGGNNAGTGANNRGVSLAVANGIQTTSSGNIVIYGTGSNSSGIRNFGFYTNSSFSAAGGNITITGIGGNGSGSQQEGIVTDAAVSTTISTTGSGTITLNGTGRGTGNSASSYGIYLYRTTISAVSGAITLTGTGGGAGSGTNNIGVYLDEGSSVASSGASPITITGIRGGGDTATNYGFRTGTLTNTVGGASATGDIIIIADTISLAANTVIQTTGNITVRPYTASTTIGVGTGAGTLTWTDTYLGYLTWGTVAAGKSLTIGGTSAGNITISSASTIFNKDVNFLTGGNITLQTTTLTHTGATASTLTMKAYGNITISSAISANTSALTVLLQSDFDGNSDGYVNVSAAITSNGGNITIGGGSGTITAGTLNADASLNTAATGFAYGNGTQVYGVYIVEAVSAGGGNIIINGRGRSTASNANYGVYITFGAASVTTTGSGTINITGIGGGGASGDTSQNRGVEIFQATVTTVDGLNTVIGTGGGAGTGSNSRGILISNSGSIKTTGTGNIRVNGTGGASSGISGTGVDCSNADCIQATSSGSIAIYGTASGSGASGIDLNLSGSITSNGGAIVMTGIGSGNASGIALLTSATISTTGSGTITLTGTGGGSASGSNNYGVSMQGATVSAVNGAIAVTGTGGGSGATNNNIGVNLASGSSISSTGASPITVTGIRGGGDTASNFGIRMTSGSNTIGGASATGDITLIADTISLVATSNIQTTGNITVRPYTASTTIGVGTGAGTLTWTDTYLGYLTWGTVAAGKSLTIGGTSAGNITISSASTIFNKNVNFLTGGNITLQTTTLTHTGATASTLTMKAYGNITISSAITANTSALTVLIQSDFDANSDGYIAVGGVITSNGGNVTLCGGSGTCTGGSLNADGTLNTAATGFAYGNATQVYGVYINNVTVAAGGANVIINGTGYNTTTNGNYGVYITGSSGAVTTTGTGTIIVSGNGGGASGNSDSNFGIYVTSGQISSANGNITLIGNGGGAGSGTANAGVYVSTNPGVNTSGSGSIYINGTGGNASGSGGGNFGVWLAGTTAVNAQSSGNIVLYGTGGNASGSGSQNFGVYNQGGIVANGGTITLTGTGGTSTANENQGIRISSGASVTNTGAGTITLKGIGGGRTNSGDNDGIYISNGIVATVNGDITVHSDTRGGGAGNGSENQGLTIDSVGTSSMQTSGSGNIVITATGGNTSGSSNHGVAVHDTNGIITTGSGNITINGTAGGTGSSARGVDVSAANAINTTGSGNIIINGTGSQSSTGSTNYGVIVGNGDSVTASGGNITVTGIAGTGTSSNHGVFVQIGTISTTGSGNIQVEGTAKGTSTTSHGVFVSGGLITAVNGTVTVTGTGSQTGTTPNHGISIQSTGGITSTGNGPINLTGVAGAGATSVGLHTATGTNTIGGASATGDITITTNTLSLAASTVIQTSGNMTIKPYTAATTIGVGAGAGTLSLTDTYLGYFTWGTVAANKSLTIGGISAGNITINSASTIYEKNVNFLTGGNITHQTTTMAHSGGTASTVTMKAYGNITISRAITASNSALTLLIQSDFDGNSDGYISISAAITSNGGNITLCGGSGTCTGAVLNADGSVNTAATGFAYGNSTQNYGIYINNVTVAAGGGNIIANGRGYAGTTNNYGIYITGASAGLTTTGTGTVTVSGIGGAGSTTGNYGVYLESGGVISSVNGDNKVVGTGGAGTNSNHGVYITGTNSSIKTTGSGSVFVNGTASGSGTFNRGVYVASTNGIQATSSGNITVRGTGAAGVNDNYGVYVNGSIAASGGNVSVTGQGGNGIDVLNHGVYLAGSGTTPIISTTGSGSITINGTGVGTSNTNRGVYITGGAISAVDGNVSVTGQGSTTGDGASAGVYIAGGTIETTGLGSVSVTGTGGQAGNYGNNYGIYLSVANGIRATGSGNITVHGTASENGGTTNANYGVYVLSTGSITASGGNVSVTGIGGTGAGGSASNGNHGVVVSGASATISTTGSGTVTIDGTGKGTNTDNYGVYITNGLITAVNGTLTVTGTGSSTGSNNNHGISLQSSADITSTGSGPINVTGIAGAGAASVGIHTLTGTNTIGGGSATGDITVTSNALSLAASTAIQTTGNITVKPYTAATTVGVGTGAGTLSLTNTYLGYFTWGTVAAGKSLTIGSVTAGDITISSSSTIFDKNVNFLTGGNIVLQTTTLTHTGATASTLTMRAYGNITINSAISANTSALTVLLHSDYDAAGGGSTTIAAGITSNGSTITLQGGGASINTASALDDLTINIGSNTATLAQALDLNGNFTLTAGTFNQATFAMTVSGNMTIANGGVFTKSSNSSTLTFDGTTSSTFTDSNATVNNIGDVVTNKTSGVAGTDQLILGSNMTVDTMTVGAGDTLDLGSGSYVFELANAGATSTVLTVNGSISGGTSTTRFTATNSGGSIDVPAAAYSSLRFSGNETYALTGNLTGGNAITGSITIDAGGATFDTSAGPYNISVGGSWTNNGSYVSGANTTTFTGSGNITTGGTGATQDFNNLVINASGTYTVQTNDIDVDGTFQVTGGAINMNGRSLTSAGLITVNGGTLTAGSGTVTANSGFTISSGTYTGASSSVLDVNGDFTISGGAFTAPGSSGSFTISGSFTKSGSPTFTHNSGTITFDGAPGNVTIDAASVTFNQIAINKSGGNGSTSTFTVATGTTLPLGNNPTITLNDTSSTVLTHLTNNGTLSGTGTLTFAPDTSSGLLTNNGTISGFTTWDLNGNFTQNASGVTSNVATITATGSFIVHSSSTFPNGGAITFDGAPVTMTVDTDNVTWASAVINKSGANGSVSTFTVDAGTTLPLGNNATITLDDTSGGVATHFINNGTLSAGTGTFTISLDTAGSNFTNNGTIRYNGTTTQTVSTGTFSNSSGSTVIFGSDSDGALDTQTLTNFGTSFHHVTVDSLGGGFSDVWQLGSGLDVNGNLTITSGTLDANGQNMSVGGSWSNAGAYTSGNNTVTFDGSGNITTGGTGAGQDFNNVIINASGTYTLQTNDVDIDGTLQISGGTLNLNGRSLTSGGLITVNGGTYTAGSGTTNANAGFTISSGTFTGSSGTLNVTGDYTQTNGTFTAPAATNISGNFAKSGGTFTANSGVVTFTGTTTATISGNPMFYDLAIASTVGKIVRVTGGSGITVTNANTFTVGNNVTLTSTDTTAWDLNVNNAAGSSTGITFGTGGTMSYANNTSTNLIDASGVTDGGNNIRFNFASSGGSSSGSGSSSGGSAPSNAFIFNPPPLMILPTPQGPMIVPGPAPAPAPAAPAPAPSSPSSSSGSSSSSSSGTSSSGSSSSSGGTSGGSLSNGSSSSGSPSTGSQSGPSSNGGNGGDGGNGGPGGNGNGDGNQNNFNVNWNDFGKAKSDVRTVVKVYEGKVYVTPHTQDGKTAKAVELTEGMQADARFNSSPDKVKVFVKMGFKVAAFVEIGNASAGVYKQYKVIYKMVSRAQQSEKMSRLKYQMAALVQLGDGIREVFENKHELVREIVKRREA